MEGLRTDVARLPLRVLGAFLRSDRYGRRILRIGMKLLGAAAFLYQFAEFVVSASLPVLFLAGRSAVARLAAAALLGIGTVKWGSAGGAMREDHPSVWAASRAFRLALRPFCRHGLSS